MNDGYVLHDDDILMSSMNCDDDMLLYVHNYVVKLWDVVVDDSLGGEMLSLDKYMFCLLSEGDFKHYVIVALTCYDMHSLCRCYWWKMQVTLRAGWIDDLFWIWAG